MASEKEIISWKAPEYEARQRSVDWYWWVGTVAVAMLIFAIWQRSFLFGVLVLLSWFTTVLYAVRPPREISISISDQGVMFGRNLYLWPGLKSFWIFYNPPLRREVSIESQKTFMPYLKIPLGETDPEKIKTIIKKFLPEVEQKESLIDNLSHLAKF